MPFAVWRSGLASRHQLDFGSETVVVRGRITGVPSTIGSNVAYPHGERLRILVVDDNMDAASLLGQAQQRLGHEIRTAFDGPTALQQAREFRPEVALLDLGLPVMDGYELAEHLRRTGQTAKLVAVTGYGQQSDRQRSQASGFDAHIVKPVDLDTLQETIRDVLGLRERGGS